MFKTFDRRSTGAMDTSHLNEALQLLCIDLTEEERNDPKYKLAGRTSGKHVHEINTPVYPTFVKLGFAGVTYLVILTLENIGCGYSLELPRCGSNVCTQSMF